MDDCDLWVHRVARMVLADNHSKELAQKRIMAYQAMLDDNLEKSLDGKGPPNLPKTLTHARCLCMKRLALSHDSCRPHVWVQR